MAGRGPTPADERLAKAVKVSSRAVERWRQAGMLRTLGGRGVPVSYPEGAQGAASCIATVLATPRFRCLHAACLVAFLRGHVPTELALRKAYVCEYTAFTAMLESAGEAAARRVVSTRDPLELAKHAARHFSRRSGTLGREMRGRLAEAGEVSLPAALESVLGIVLGVRGISPADLVLVGFGSLAFASPTIRAKTGPSTLDAFDQAIAEADWDDLMLARGNGVSVYESARQMSGALLGVDLPSTGKDVALDFALALFGIPAALLLRWDLGDAAFDQVADVVKQDSFADLVTTALGAGSKPRTEHSMT